MIGIKGPRGAGKTTLLLQHLKFDLGEQVSKALYITADHTWFYNHTLLDTATDWFRQGGRILFVDEVHKYPRWSRELKNIYDGLPEMQVIFSASSALDIYRGEADLSRRVISYSLAGLSFREYIAFTGGPLFEPLTLQTLQQSHREHSLDVIAQLHPLPVFNKYLKKGYLPIIAEGENEYLPKLEQVINAIVDTDLAYIASYNAGTAVKVKKLLAVIAESAPFKPNISALAAKLDIGRDSIYEYIHQLKDAKLLNVLMAEGKGVSRLQKPDKIYLENANLAYAIGPVPDKGNVRETFLLNQLINAGMDVYAPVSGDFLTAGITIEVGGKNKTAKQVKNADAYIVAADDVETGFGGKVPLWMFGFLY
jgi:predicted AAA+ superfamily ATPase